MNKFRFTIQAFAIATLTFAFASITQAQATRTWVSGVGDDANPCSRTAPCKTFAGAISKTAPQGEIDVLDPGGFGALTITKPITIDGGEGQIAGVLVNGGINAIVVQAGINDVVTLRNLDIDGLGTGLNGILINGAKAVHIDHCQIYGFTADGIQDARTATQNPAARLFINDCFIRNNNAGGIAVVGNSANGTGAFIDNTRVQGNGGFGIAASNNDTIEVLHCIVTQNSAEAVRADTGGKAVVVSSVLNNNSTGALGNGTSFILADTTILNNVTGVSGTFITFGSNNITNNAGGNSIGVAPTARQ